MYVIVISLLQILKYKIWPERKPGEPELMYTALLESFLSAPEERPPIAQPLDDFKNYQKHLEHTSTESGIIIKIK